MCAVGGGADFEVETEAAVVEVGGADEGEVVIDD